MFWRRKPPELGKRSLTPVSYTAGTVPELVHRYAAAGLKLNADVSPEAAGQPLTAEVLSTVLAAAHRNDIADVSFTAQCADGQTQLRAAARTIDRSVAIEFARALGLLELRREVELAGGTIRRAHTRFAIFHLDIDLPLA